MPEVAILNFAYTDVIAETDDSITICPNANAQVKYHWELSKKPSYNGRGADVPMILRLRQKWGIRELTVYEFPLLLP